MENKNVILLKKLDDLLDMKLLEFNIIFKKPESYLHILYSKFIFYNLITNYNICIYSYSKYY